MFIAMNRFKVVPGSQADFEQVWTTRDTHLRDVPGFINFHLLRGPDREDHTLYSSHSVWRRRADFEAWTRSEAFRRAHRDVDGARHRVEVLHHDGQRERVALREEARRDGARLGLVGSHPRAGQRTAQNVTP